MNGFNTSHDGVSAADFVECRMSFETKLLKAIKEAKEKEGSGQEDEE